MVLHFPSSTICNYVIPTCRSALLSTAIRSALPAVNWRTFSVFLRLVLMSLTISKQAFMAKNLWFLSVISNNTVSSSNNCVKISVCYYYSCPYFIISLCNNLIVVGQSRHFAAYLIRFLSKNDFFVSLWRFPVALLEFCRFIWRHLILVPILMDGFVL